MSATGFSPTPRTTGATAGLLRSTSPATPPSIPQTHHRRIRRCHPPYPFHGEFGQRRAGAGPADTGGSRGRTTAPPSPISSLMTTTSHSGGTTRFQVNNTLWICLRCRTNSSAYIAYRRLIRCTRSGRSSISACPAPALRRSLCSARTRRPCSTVILLTLTTTGMRRAGRPTRHGTGRRLPPTTSQLSRLVNPHSISSTTRWAEAMTNGAATMPPRQARFGSTSSSTIQSS